MHGDNAAFDGRAGAKGHDRHLVRGADPGDLGYFFDAGREGHSLWRLRGVIGGVGGVGAEHLRGLIQARAEESGQCRQGLGVYGIHGAVICPTAGRPSKRAIIDIQASTARRL